MRIAHLSKPYAPIPPVGYGGIERSIYALVTAQQRNKNNDVHLFAPGDSVLPAGIKLHALFAKSLEPGTEGTLSRDVEAAQAMHCGLTLRRAAIDILHVHSVNAYLALAPFLGQKTIFTFRMCPDSVTELLARAAEPYVTYTFLSHQHRRQFPWIARGEVVYIGFDVASYPFSAVKGDYLAFVGSIADKKGVLEAIEISRRCKMRLRIGAHIKFRDKEFYQETIQPLLAKSDHVEFLGEVTDEQRNALLRHARALLFPIKWEEPFGRVMAESMAVGTPVIAFNRGSVPEVVADGKTGYIVENVAQAVAAVRKLDTITPRACRQHIIDNFSIARTVREFGRLYAATVGQS